MIIERVSTWVVVAHPSCLPTHVHTCRKYNIAEVAQIAT